MPRKILVREPVNQQELGQAPVIDLHQYPHGMLQTNLVFQRMNMNGVRYKEIRWRVYLMYR